MTAKEKVEWTLCLLLENEHFKEDCFYCRFGPYYHAIFPEMLTWALVTMGVPNGIYKTFGLEDGRAYSKANKCGSEANWQKFIDEVASLLGE